MNILVLGWRGPKHPNAGGAEQVVHEHCKSWILAGHKVTLFTSAYKNCKDEEFIDGLKIIRRSFQYFGVHISAFFWYVFKNKEKFDLVIDQFHGIPFFTPLYVKTKKIALIQEVAKEVWFFNQFPKPINYLIGLIGFLGEPFLFLFYRKIPFITGSKSAKDDLISYGVPDKNISVIPHGVKIIGSSKVYKKSKPYILSFLGAVTKDKGVEDAIRCFSLLKEKEDFVFWIVGKYSKNYKEDLDKMITKFGIIDKVKFWGYVSEKKKFNLLKKTYILINPSVREGWGLVNIEANSFGAPVVAYNSSGLRDSVVDGRSGLLVKENTPQALSQAVLELIQDKMKYLGMQKTSVLWSKKFTWKFSANLSLSLIESV